MGGGVCQDWARSGSWGQKLEGHTGALTLSLTAWTRWAGRAPQHGSRDGHIWQLQELNPADLHPLKLALWSTALGQGLRWALECTVIFSTQTFPFPFSHVLKMRDLL